MLTHDRRCSALRRRLLPTAPDPTLRDPAASVSAVPSVVPLVSAGPYRGDGHTGGGPIPSMPSATSGDPAASVPAVPSVVALVSAGPYRGAAILAVGQY